MARIPFEELPDHGRLWVFPCSRALSSREAETFIDTVHSFLDDWKAHGVPLRCSGELRDGQFLVVGVDCLLYTSPSPRDATLSRMPSSA